MPLPGSCSTRPHAAAVGLAAVPLLKTRAFCRRPTKGGRVSNGGARSYRVLARGASHPHDGALRPQLPVGGLN